MTREIVSDALAIAGFAAVTFGAWQLSEAAGWIVGGAFAVLVGILAAPTRGDS